MTQNKFRNGYTCLECLKERINKKNTPFLDDFEGKNLPPLYRRVKGKFEFARLVECKKHGITEAVALRDLHSKIWELIMEKLG